MRQRVHYNRIATQRNSFIRSFIVAITFYFAFQMPERIRH